MTKALSRRTLLKGFAAARPVALALPPLEAMFNSAGTMYAAEQAPIESRFVFWFNGNGIPEKYWIPAETGADFVLTPCLAPLATFRDDIHIVTGIDSPAARMPGPGNDHHRSMSALMTGTRAAMTGNSALMSFAARSAVSAARSKPWARRAFVTSSFSARRKR